MATCGFWPPVRYHGTLKRSCSAPLTTGNPMRAQVRDSCSAREIYPSAAAPKQAMKASVWRMINGREPMRHATRSATRSFRIILSVCCPCQFIADLSGRGLCKISGCDCGGAYREAYIKTTARRGDPRLLAPPRVHGGTNSAEARLVAGVTRKFDMRYSVLLLPLAAVGLAGCVAASPPPTTTTTYVTPGQTTTYVVPGSTAYGTPQQSTSTTYINGAPTPYAPGTQTTTTTVHPAY
jgi:hypothetical protein